MPDKKRIIILIACCINMIWIGTSIFALPGIMAPYWQKKLSIATGTVSKCPFFILLATGIFMYIVGKLQENYPPSVIVFLGSVILGATNFFLYLISSISHIFLWAFFIGCASAFLYIPCITVVQRWFLKSKGFVVGLVNLIFGISASFLGPPINKLFASSDLLIFSIIIASLSFITGTIFTPFIKFPEESIKTEDMSVGKKSFSIKQVLKDKNFWFIWVCWAFTGGAGISLITLSTLFGIHTGLSKAKAILMLSSFNFANGLGRLFTGIISDRFGRTNTMFVCFLLGGVGYAIIPLISNLYVWCVCSIMIGIAFGALFAVSAPLIMESFGVKNFGAIFGLVFTAYGFVAGPLGPWISGYLLNVTNSFSTVFFYLSAMMFLSSICIIKVSLTK